MSDQRAGVAGAERPVWEQAFDIVLRAVVAHEVERYHTDAEFHAECYRRAARAAAELSDARLLVSDGSIGPDS